MIRNGWLCTLWLVALLAWPDWSFGQNEGVNVGLSVRATDLCATIEWDEALWPADVRGEIQVRYVDDEDFHFAAVANSTPMFYCLPRQACGDTVVFRLAFFDGEGLLIGVSECQGDVFEDTSPTTPCEVGVASADEASGQVMLTWHPSPDSDIMGYYICSGVPCLDFDTVWGREDTTLLCLGHADTVEHLYRLLAFDSCMHPSPLTDYFGNVVVRAVVNECEGEIELSWNEYRNIASGLQGYRLTMQYDDGSLVDTLVDAGETSLSLDLLPMADSVFVSLVAIGTDGTSSVANRLALSLPQPARARYVEIERAEYNLSTGSVEISARVDSLFVTSRYVLLRGVRGGAFQVVATQPYTGVGRIEWSDQVVALGADMEVAYAVGVPDECGDGMRVSDTIVVKLPTTQMAGLFFPNVFTPLQESNNRFCPRAQLVDEQDFRLAVFNRMGLCVYESSDISQCWDGHRDGKPLPQGVYTYVVQVRYADHTQHTQRGTVLIIY